MNVSLFLLLITIAIIISGVISFNVYAKRKQRERPNEGKATFDEWFFGKNKTWYAIIIGMISGIIFGFIDNAGLFVGMSMLDPIFAKFPLGKEDSVFAGYGNTFSDIVGAFMATFIGRTVQDLTGVDEYPIWTEAAGIFIGCLLGIAIPRLLMGKQPNH